MRILTFGISAALLIAAAPRAQSPGEHQHAAPEHGTHQHDTHRHAGHQPGEAASKSAPTTFVVKFRVKPGRNAEFEKAFLEMQAGVRAHEPGNVYYDFFRLNDDPQTYVIVERYVDEAAVAAHGRSEHAKKMLAEIRELLDGPPEAMRLVLISAK